jgi:hypothetical protein
MFASAGRPASSPGVYPNAAATAATPAWSFDSPLEATAAYFARTWSTTDSDMIPSKLPIVDRR